VQIAAEHPQHRRLLAAMMRRVRQAARHHPRARARDVEERRLLFPPAIVSLAKAVEPLAAVFGVARDEPRARLGRRERRRADVDAEHRPEPRVLADALVDHLFAHAAAAGIAGPRPGCHVRLGEFAPHAEHLQPFGLVALDQEVVSHEGLTTCESNRP
jgi:hypothetical protein